ncbi:MAG: hypothetical protein DWQ07_23175 [Chloroflexi bacterium]|nr:MAG: hypothetical protein DWQ07_23175 [Chloroflexota bacterium]MBL1194052.1 hypothetical protein [Chloroflexota bacterium]NOH11346.1 hypothetical protein [Chloroflexota bacterium]
MGKKQDLSKRRMEALRRGDLETADKLLRELMPRQRRDQEAHDLEKEALRARRSKKLRDRNTYDVVAGDSFFSVASEVLGDARLAGALLEANPNVYVLRPGMVLDLPELDTEAEEPPLFSEEAYRDALISQELVDAIGGDPSGARVGDEDVEIEADEEFVQDSQEALAGLGMEEEALAEAVADLLINLGYTDVPVPKVMEKPAAQVEEDIDEETFEGPALETEEYLGADVSLEDGPQQDETPPSPDDEGKRGTRKVEGKGTSEPEPAVVPTEEVEPTEVVNEPLPSYEELVIAEETNWPQWENALENSGIELRDNEGELNLEEISTFIAEDIEVNKERYAQELGMTVDELAEVSKERVEIWLEAAELHGQLDVFNTSLLLKQNDQDIFGVNIDVMVDGAPMGLDAYIETQNDADIESTRLNFSIALVNMGFALSGVSPDYDDPGEVFRDVFGDVTIKFDSKYSQGWGCKTNSSREVVCGSGGLSYSIPQYGYFGLYPEVIIHELGHVLHSRIARNLAIGLGRTPNNEDKELEQIYKDKLSLFDPYIRLGSTSLYLDEDYTDGEGIVFAGPGIAERSELGWQYTDRDGYLSDLPYQIHGYELFPLPKTPEEREDYDDPNSPNERFADMFLNWVLDSFDYTDSAQGAGQAMYDWVDENAADFVYFASHTYSEEWDNRIEN